VYSLGAVLIKTGFYEYGVMKYIDEALKDMSGKLQNAAGKQQHELFEAYAVQVKRFCDVMADLGLYEVMLKCRFFAEEPEEPESSSESESEPEPEPDPIMFIDIKTGTIIAMEREEVVEKKILEQMKDRPGFREATTAKEAKEKLVDALTHHPTLGIATQVVVQKTEVEDVNLAEAEKVADVWGVSLKKREKNQKGEEFIYVDPAAKEIGELARKKYLDMGFITPHTDDSGRESLKEAIVDTLKYDDAVHAIRNAFGIKAAT
jgi:hypothetical protein